MSASKPYPQVTEAFFDMVKADVAKMTDVQLEHAIKIWEIAIRDGIMHE